jgi:hypothetical protein
MEGRLLLRTGIAAVLMALSAHARTARAQLIDAIDPTPVDFGQDPPERGFGRSLYLRLTWRA